MPSTDRRLELKAKDIDGSDRLTAGCVCQWVKQCHKDLTSNSENDADKKPPPPRSSQTKTCPSATLSTINPTWTDVRSNPNPQGDRLTTNSLWYVWPCSLNKQQNMKIGLVLLYTRVGLYSNIYPTRCNFTQFNVNKWSNLMQQYADIYLLQSHSTCFGHHSTHHQEH